MKIHRSFALAVILFCAAVLLLPVAPARAAKPFAPLGLELGGEVEEPSARRGDMRVSLETGAPLALYRVGYEVAPGEPEAMARQFLTENAALLHLREGDLADLVHRATRRGLAHTTVRLRQELGGVPVYKAEIAVTLDDHNRVVYVASTYKPLLGAVDLAPAVSAAEARRLALDHLGVVGELDHEAVELMVYRSGGVTRLVRRVNLVPREWPAGDWEVLVDAHGGELVKVADNAFYVDGSGQVFDPDPLSSAGAAYNDPGYTDGGDADTPELTAELFSRTLRDITESSGTYSLVGPWADIRDFESPFNGTFSQMSSTFDFTRQADAFEAVNTYFHIDNIMRYLNVTLGVNVAPYQYAGGVQFDPHGLGGADNSHYISSTGRVAFGEGGVDDAEDADVVIHELGHGLHDWATVGGLSQVQGLSEGIGDFMAASYSRSLGQWTPADPAYHWVFSWDGHNPFWGGRVTNWTDTRVYPDDLTGSIHTDGQFWSSCNMRIWDAIGRDKIQQAHWEGLAMTGSGTNQEDAAQAVIQAATDLGFPTGDVATMASLYQGCGYDVTGPALEIFTDGFESGDVSAWSSSVP